ncbi:type II secretion system inner membrane protein GspF [Psychrobium sp. 1_MG-2023]|uniref:type II secretion system inner membrane protein GspF n=1 Tax=Psychrobium sp. 1_MG-2023 TaxID=3062624 RepID=UPI000C31EB7A|nr:type II secretion system inner membrane protein GspF [Psychrobium sp. 1_MG-2023]MDP2561933.1 type II secretion system inner membrane protein GspF [Psychrobium sp. 1_MG-2023]PKF58684.1 type II secretion system protein GspF [Alteromonadales bacterium alter-6D02]
MAAFEYKALDKRGKETKGVIDADSSRQVRAQLREKQLMPIDVKQVASASNKQGKAQSRHKISTADLALITRQLATLIQSALPIEESLKAVAEQCDQPKITSVVMAVRSRVVEGYSLADSMAEFPQIFEKLYTAMVAAGEKSGHLDVVLNRLADYTEQRQAMRSKLMQAMIYPTMLTVVAIGVIALLLAFVVPQVIEQFAHMGQELPWATQLLIILSDGVRDYGLIFIGLLITAVVVFKQSLKRPDFELKVHHKLLNIALIGKVVRGVNTARFARTLSILTSSSVPLLESMKISARVLANRHMEEQVMVAANYVREGSSLRAALQQTKLFPPMMLHMVASGEKSGELEQMLGRAADNQDREFEAIANMTLGVFTPAIVVSMAVIVFFIVIAILQPILALNTLVG